MQLPTNYKMGTGLAATIMGSQAGLEQEKMGLENLYKGMQMPGEILKGEEQAALLNDPTYLQQKTANTLIELKNTYSAQDFQQTLDAANRVRIKLDAAAGDPVKEQQIVQESLAALKIDPNSQFGQYAMRDPRGALTKFIEGVQVGLIGTGGAKHLGEMEKQKFIESEHWKRTQAEIQGRAQNAAMQAGQVDRREAREIARAQRGFLLQDPTKIITAVDVGLNNNIDPVTLEPLTPEKRKYYEGVRDAAKRAAADKSKPVTVVAQDGTRITIGGGGAQTTPAPATASKAGQSEAEKAGY